MVFILNQRTGVYVWDKRYHIDIAITAPLCSMNLSHVAGTVDPGMI